MKMPAARACWTMLFWIVAVYMAGARAFVQAAIPVSGTVVEGNSFPGGLTLGATRAAILAAYGSPSFCQGPTSSLCTYTITGVGSVNVGYRSADGGEAAGTPEDVVQYASWVGYEQWITTAGVTTSLALSDPSAVTNAYPNGEVTYNILGGIYRLNDPGQGIQVTWVPNFYTGTVVPEIMIFAAAQPVSRLTLRREGTDMIEIRWPIAATGFTLESAEAMGGPWEPVAIEPVPDATDYCITQPLGATARFFRLRKN
jgi:hypothetical protein